MIHDSKSRTLISNVCSGGGYHQVSPQFVSVSQILPENISKLTLGLSLVCVPDLFELSSQDLQVVEGPSHGEHHLSVVAGGHADVPALWLLPFTH